jgi:DNA-binding XRE family transcriptional regulator
MRCSERDPHENPAGVSLLETRLRLKKILPTMLIYKLSSIIMVMAKILCNRLRTHLTSNRPPEFGIKGNGSGFQKQGVTTLARTKSLSKQIRQAREGKGFTVAELADRLGVSQVSIYYWESGRVRPRDTNLTALCKALKMPVRETMALTGR